MKVSDVFFSGNRFGYLFKKELMEDMKKNLMRCIVLFGIFLVLFLFVGFNSYSTNPYFSRTYDILWDFMTVFFMFGIFFGACLSATYITEKMKNKTGKISVMMLPATSFEKFSVRWLTYCIGFLLVYFLAFELAVWIRVLVFPKETINSFPVWRVITTGEFRTDEIVSSKQRQIVSIVIAVFWAMQSFFVLGSTLWQKNSFLKTAVALFALCAGIGLLVYWSSRLFIPNDFYKAEPESISEETALLMVSIFFYAIALFNTVLAYFRYKEMEVINRW